MVRRHFAPDGHALDTMFGRFESLFEQLDGHMLEVAKTFRTQLDLDQGPVMPYDEVFAGYDPSAHVIEDFFKNGLAFAALLNFPLTTLDERLREGAAWSRRRWAEVRLAQRFARRIPAEVNLALSEAAATAGRYVAEYNIWMHHLVDRNGARLFPPGLRLLSHWNLRDEIKAAYSDGALGFARQKEIQKVFERIVTQTIPSAVIDNPGVDWDPVENTVAPAAVRDADAPAVGASGLSPSPEPDRRYEMLLSTFRAATLVDPHSPTAPTLIARRFDEDREIPERRIREFLSQILGSSLVPEVARLIRSRLGRPLEPFDIWYNGFRARGAYTEAQLNALVAERYPTAESFKRDIPELLMKLGFGPDRAGLIAANIVVDPARGSGHAMESAMRSAPARLRTRIDGTGMNYKGFNVAIHELGHTVEQTISLHLIDHTLLRGVPNTAFTEAFAFVFQGRDLELLGLSRLDAKSEATKVVNDFWATYEIAGAALVDMDVWRWLYDHPEAGPSELKRATLEIAANYWNRYYAPVFRKDDVLLLAVYSHMIDSFMYLPDYPIGHLIAFQIEEQMRKTGSIGAEFERMAVAGRISPDLWMANATGSSVGTDALLETAGRALKELQ